MCPPNAILGGGQFSGQSAPNENRQECFGKCSPIPTNGLALSACPRLTNSFKEFNAAQTSPHEDIRTFSGKACMPRLCKKLSVDAKKDQGLVSTSCTFSAETPATSILINSKESEMPRSFVLRRKDVSSSVGRRTANDLLTPFPVY